MVTFKSRVAKKITKIENVIRQHYPIDGKMCCRNVKKPVLPRSSQKFIKFKNTLLPKRLFNVEKRGIFLFIVAAKLT
jgi:hypothetical protein